MYIVPDTGNNSLTFIEDDKITSKITIDAPREIVAIKGAKYFAVSGLNQLYIIQDKKIATQYSFDSEIRAITNYPDGHILGVLKDSDKLFVVDIENKNIQYHDLKCTGPRQIFVDENMIYIVGNTSNSIDIFDYEKQSLVKSFNTGSAPYSVSVDKDSIYIGCIEDETITAYNKHDLQQKWQTVNINHPTKILKKQKTLYITNFDNHTVSILKAENGELVGTKQVEDNPFDIKIDNNYFLISSNKGSLNIYDKNFELIDTVTKFNNLHHFYNYQ